MTAPDLSKPTMLAARHLAHRTALASGKEAAAALMARLLFHIEVDDGGLLGADDWRVAMVRRRFGISVEAYMDALYAAGPWPVAAAEKEAA